MRDYFFVYLRNMYEITAIREQVVTIILCMSLSILSVFFIPSYASSHHPQEFLKSIQGSNNEGEQIYTHFCVNCHAQKPMIPIGAPRIGVEKDWSHRLKKEVSVLLKNTLEGLNSMPPRGGCFECTDEQVLLALLYMIPKQAKSTLLNELRDHKRSKE